MTFDPSKLWPLCPRALRTYKEAFRDAATVFTTFGLVTPLRVSHFLAQVLHETGGFTLLVEDLNYSPERLMVVWPSRFHSLTEARPYAHNPKALANRTYGGRMGNVGPDDGWKFIGRGMLQLTGRENYWRIGRFLDIDLIDNPNLVLLPEYALSVACAEWQWLGCNAIADTDDVRKVTRAVNGGLTGLEQRRTWLSMVRRAYADGTIHA